MNSFNWASTVNPNKCENVDSLTKIRIEGLLTTEAFQKARLCALKLHRHLPHKFSKPVIIEMLQISWHDKLRKMQRCFGAIMRSLKRPVVVFIDDEFIGSDNEFIRYIGKTYAFNLPIHSDYYENLIAQQYKRYIEQSEFLNILYKYQCIHHSIGLQRKYAYFTFTIDGKVIGSFLIMLYTDLVPRTCQHFLKLCSGWKSKNAYGTILHYKNTTVHRIVKNGWLQLGDILESNEDFDETVINEVTIDDESYCIPHDRRGVISMANDGKHSNRDQFIVSLKSNDWMNCYYVAFGQLVDGANTLKIIENIPTYYEGPLKKIFISECGEYSFDRWPMTTMIKDHEGRENEEIEGDDQDRDTSHQRHFLSDTIDERDVASLMMVERYQRGLYSLSTDNLPESRRLVSED